MVAKVGRYRSRRSRVRSGGAAVAGGGLVDAVHTDRLKQAVGEIKHAVHHAADHEPMEIINAVQKHIPHHAEHIHDVLREAANDLRDYSWEGTPAHHNYTTSYPNLRGPDPMAFAKHLRQKYIDVHHKETARTGGGLDFGDAMKVAKQVTDPFNPAESINQMMDATDSMNLKDNSIRGIAKNALYAHSASMHGHAAYTQTSALALAPFWATGVALGGSAGFAAAGIGFNKVGDASSTLADRL